MYSEVLKMFRVQKGYDSESKTFRLPVDMIRKLEKIAAENKISLNQLVVQCVNYALENLEEPEQNTQNPQH